MEDIKITFLGTGNAIPTRLRNHTGILLSFLNENILIDCGEGIQRQFKIASISPTKLTRILITHWHGDHILGLPGLFQSLAMSEYKKNLVLYGPRGTKEYISRILELINGIKINLEVYEISSGIFLENKIFALETQHMRHGPPALAYSIMLKDRIHLDKKKLKKYKLPNTPLMGQLAEGKDIVLKSKTIKASSVSYLEKGKKVSVILDTAMNENAIKLAEKADLLITEATFSEKEAEHAKEYLHLTSAQAASIAKKAGVKKLILTHISERYEHSLHIIEKEAKKVFKNTSIAKDFDIIKV